jgi:hypothetical protein
MPSTQEQSYIQLLSDPSCKIKPEWVINALCSWLKRNMVEFLKENPHMLAQVSHYDYHIRDIADVVPVDDEHIDLIKLILAKCPAYALLNLLRKLADNGKADMIVDVDGHQLSILPREWVKEYIGKMGTDAVIRALKKLKLEELLIDDDVIKAMVEHLSPDQMVDVLGMQDETATPRIVRNGHRILTMTISVFLKKLPLNVAKRFADYCARNMKPVTCMKCARNFCSKSGLASHRRKCDPKDEYPSIEEVMSRRIAIEGSMDGGIGRI